MDMDTPQIFRYEDQDDYDEIHDFLEEDPPGLGRNAENEFEADVRCAIAVDGLPIITRDKEEKLKKLLRKRFSAHQELTDEDITFPYDPSSGSSLGFCFMVFQSPAEAEMTMKELNGTDLVKDKHTLVISPVAEVLRYGRMPDEYLPPAPPEFAPRPDPSSWLSDEQCRDQFVTRHQTPSAHETEIWWSNMEGDPELVYDGEDQKTNGRNWCERKVAWSPGGTYLATFHPRGVALWGGERFGRQGRFEHANVEQLSFSPDEKHMVTYRFSADASQSPAVIVWGVRDARKIRPFPLKDPMDLRHLVQVVADRQTGRTVVGRIELDNERGTFTIDCGGNNENYAGSVNIVQGFGFQDREFLIEEEGQLRPLDVQALCNPNVLKWSHDGSYLARLASDIISVYELPRMGLLDRKSIAAQAVVDFEWSPGDNVIAYWAAGVGNNPSRITLLALPSREELARRNLFNVTNGRLFWHNDGDYLAVLALKHARKVVTTLLIVFRLKEPGIPVEQVELTEPIMSIAWEPNGHRFAAVVGDRRSQKIQFYTMVGPGNTREMTLVTTLGSPEDVQERMANKRLQQFDRVYWSPAGGVAVICFHQTEAQMFDFYDVDQRTYLTDAVRKHDLGKQITWDPSGRIVASIATAKGSQLKADLDFGFHLFTFQGDSICRVRKSNMSQFSWRPRPKVLTAEQRRHISKNLSAHKKRFAAQDRERRQAMRAEQQRGRIDSARAFFAFERRCHEDYLAAREELVAMRGGFDIEDDACCVVKEEVVETIVSSREEVLED